MAQRILQISPEVLTFICKGMGDGPPRYFDVISDPVPEDARIVQTRYKSSSDCVEIILESTAWDGMTAEELAEPMLPMCRAVEVPKPTRGREFI